MNILGLDNNDFEKLKIEVVEYFSTNKNLEDDFEEFLIQTFKLDGKRSELLEFCDKYCQKTPSRKLQILPKITAYLTKKKIIDFIVKDEKTPTLFMLKK